MCVCVCVCVCVSIIYADCHTDAGLKWTSMSWESKWTVCPAWQKRNHTVRAVDDYSTCSVCVQKNPRNFTVCKFPHNSMSITGWYSLGTNWPGLGHHGRGLVQQLGLMVCVEGSGIRHVVQNVTAHQSIPAVRQWFCESIGFLLKRRPGTDRMALYKIATTDAWRPP